MLTVPMHLLFNGLDKNIWSQGRLETFKRWPFKPEDGICTAERMAAAGFFVIENQDEDAEISVQCFLCNKQLDGWEPNDDPWQEHIKHQIKCPFVELNKQDEMQWTIDELFNLIQVYYINRANLVVKEMNTNIESKYKEMVKEIPKIVNGDRKSRKG